jgi:hypothetical protein
MRFHPKYANAPTARSHRAILNVGIGNPGTDLPR